MPRKHATVDEYLADLPEDRRARLESLRRTVVAAAPDGEECIAYDMPALRLDGRFFVSYGAYRRHDSLFPASAMVLERVDGAAAYAKGRGTFQFPLAQELPLELIGRIVGVRLEEHAQPR
jgi:uncharacterized protein YdhG (YjbR/CyaY superfamily)